MQNIIETTCYALVDDIDGCDGLGERTQYATSKIVREEERLGDAV